MRLLFAIKQLRSAVGGAERVFCTLCSELVSRGHEVTCITFDKPGSVPFYPLDMRVRRIDLGVGDVMTKAGFAETFKRIRCLRQCLNEVRPEVAVGFMHSMFVPLAIAGWGTSIPVIGSEHIVPEHYETRRFEYSLLLATAPLLRKLTVLSASIRDRYPYIVRRRMVVAPNPIAKLDVHAKAPGNTGRKTLLTVGRLDPQKDQLTLIRAFGMVAQTFPEWDLRIIGEGELRSAAEDLISELGLSGRVALPGVTKQIEREYAGADIFVLSSLYESFGLVTAEAMSVGLPVIGFSDCPGTNELISDGGTGILVDPGRDRATSLAKGMKRLMGDETLRGFLGSNGRKFVTDHFSVESVCSLWESWLEHTVSARQS